MTPSAIRSHTEGDLYSNMNEWPYCRGEKSAVQTDLRQPRTGRKMTAERSRISTAAYTQWLGTNGFRIIAPQAFTFSEVFGG